MKINQTKLTEIIYKNLNMFKSKDLRTKLVAEQLARKIMEEE